MKQLVRRTGVFTEKLLFVCNASDFQANGIYFDYVGRLMAGFEIPELFTNEERGEMVELYQKHAKESVRRLLPLVLTQPNHNYHLKCETGKVLANIGQRGRQLANRSVRFTSRCFVQSTVPLPDDFQLLVSTLVPIPVLFRIQPDYLFISNIPRFDPWPDETLEAIAKKCLEEMSGLNSDLQTSYLGYFKTVHNTMRSFSKRYVQYFSMRKTSSFQMLLDETAGA